MVHISRDQNYAQEVMMTEISTWSKQQIDILASELCNILRASLCSGYTPKIWREVNMVFIPKSGRETYVQAEAYWIVSLTSFLLKALERLIENI